MVYSKEILDRFDAAAAQVAAASQRMREYLGTSSESAVKHELDKARAAYDKINAELDASDA